MAPLTVFAAASLREVFEELAALYEARSGQPVRLSFAGSQELRTQIEQGARPALFASADGRQMEQLRSQGLIEPPHVFASNGLALAVSEKLQAPLHDLADLPMATRIVLGVPEVPIGAYSEQLLDRAEQRYGPGFRQAVASKVVSRELNVRQLLAKVALGEADAGLVYQSDLKPPPPGVRAVAIEPALQVKASYYLASVKGGASPQELATWMAVLRSPEGQSALAQRGLR